MAVNHPIPDSNLVLPMSKGHSEYNPSAHHQISIICEHSPSAPHRVRTSAKERSQVTGGLLTICSPLLWRTPSCSTRFLEMVMEGRSRLCGGNWGVNSFPWEGNGSLRAWKGSSTSGMPRVGSDSGGGVIGGISNSSSPRLGVWNVC